MLELLFHPNKRVLSAVRLYGFLTTYQKSGALIHRLRPEIKGGNCQRKYGYSREEALCKLLDCL